MMIPNHILVVGTGLLAEQVSKLLAQTGNCEVIRKDEVSWGVPSGVNLGLVLDDGWNPSAHFLAEQVFHQASVPWLRGFVMFGNGLIGPLVLPGKPGCSQCADLRLMMAEPHRREMFEFKIQLSSRNTATADAWAGRSGLWHMASIILEEVHQFLNGGEEASRGLTVCHLVDHVVALNLKTLDVSQHFILPDACCPVCGAAPDDSAKEAVVHLEPNPKVSADDFRREPLSDFKQQLMHDYLDYNCGLFNGKVHDLVTPFAAVSVNLPLMIGDEGTSGRSHFYDECEWVAILEGLERYCGLEPRGKRTVVYDAYANLQDDALNPTTVGLHSPAQYQLPDFPFQRYDPDSEFGWVWGYSLTANRPMLVPERLAYYSLGNQGGFVYETSNGCALGNTLMEAIFHGMLEVVERDAFLMTWYTRLPLSKIDVESTTNAELHWMMDRIRAVAGYDLHFYNATMENKIPTVFVIAKNRRPHGLNLLCSAGTHVDPMRAIKSAVHETAGMLLRFDEKLERHKDVYLRMLNDSSDVRRMEDHSMLYGLPEAEERLAFLLDEQRPVDDLSGFLQRDSKHMDLTEDLKDLLAVFRKLKLDVIVVNQTSPEIQRNGLHCVKVIIPGMLPMTFGHHLTRLEHLDRVFHVPMTLGYTDQPLTPGDLNPFPHPFP